MCLKEDNSKQISKSLSVTPQDVNDNGNIHAPMSSYGHLDVSALEEHEINVTRVILKVLLLQYAIRNMQPII